MKRKHKPEHIEWLKQHMREIQKTRTYPPLSEERKAKLRMLRKSPISKRLRQRNNGLKCKFGLSLDKYDELWIEQIGLCPICHTHLNEGYSDYVDHDHKTKKVRGLLCRACNHGIGELKDDPISLLNAINYLEQ